MDWKAAMRECLRADNPGKRCGYHHATGRRLGAGFACCCGRAWTRFSCCNNFPTYSKAGDPVTEGR